MRKFHAFRCLIISMDICSNLEENSDIQYPTFIKKKKASEY